jgi:hypothetical protein
MSSSISVLMRSPRLREVDRVAVASNPDDTWAFVRSTFLYELPWVGTAVAARAAVERLVRPRRRALHAADTREPQLVAGAGGDAQFPLLDERPGRELVTGAIARFWESRVPLCDVAARDFATFDEPGYGKLACSLQVDPREGGGSWIGLELRGDATDDESYERLVTYWRRFEARARTARRAVARALVRRLGKPPSESMEQLPGDELVAFPFIRRTHAITVEAPPCCVWPWLAQMGCHRAGWYAMDSLYNGGNRSLRSIRHELQHPRVGDLFATSTRPGDALAALLVEPERALVLGSPAFLWDRSACHESSALEEELMTWAFVLEPIGSDATRLVVRLRRDQEVSTLDAALRPLVLARHELMEQTQLENLKWLAEALARSRELASHHAGEAAA